MTGGLPYLRNLRKTDLVDLAEISKLRNYVDLKKSDLETALDKHLWANRARLASDSALADYFRRANAAASAAASKIESAAAAAGAGAAERASGSRTPGRGRSKAKTDSSSDDSSRSASPTTAMKASMKRTPTRARAVASAATNSTTSAMRAASHAASHAATQAPQLAACCDKMANCSRAMMGRIVNFLESSASTACLRIIREYAGSAWIITLSLLVLEMVGLGRAMCPLKKFADFSFLKLWLLGRPPSYASSSPATRGPPVVSAASAAAAAAAAPVTAMYTFDPSSCLSSPVPAVTSLYLLIGVFLPLLVSYVMNPTVEAELSYSSGGGGAKRTPRFSGAKTCFDPLMFSLSRGLIMHCVLRSTKTGTGQVPMYLDKVWNPAIVDLLGTIMPGGISGVAIRSVVGAVVSLYEAVLRK
ncbi:hypothetical protein KEM52_006740 [Ascosphaera acerosa]|nr:hypothetical protein KEM52_006740 [Ascosphaera acerosa]